jgi:hypothetical protein
MVIVSYCLLAFQPDLRLAVPLLVGLAGIVTASLAGIVHLEKKGAVGLSPVLIMVLALGMRALFFFRRPELSDDIYRYLLDGLQMLSGNNPYGLAPDEVHPSTEALARLLPRINHPELPTIYPPMAQYLFALGAAFGHSVAGVKALFILLDLASCGLILRLLKTLGRSYSWAILYAWHPVAVIEVAASGHVDAAGIFFLLLTLIFLIKAGIIPRTGIRLTLLEREPEGVSENRPLMLLAAGTAFSAAVLIKLFPLMFLPGLLLLLGLRSSLFFCTGLAAGTGLLTLPFIPEVAKGLTTFSTYLRHWEFSGFAFRTLRRITSSGDFARLLLALGFFTFLGVEMTRFGLKRSTLSTVPESAMNPTLESFYRIAICFLLLTPTLYPWYTLHLIWLFPFILGPAGLTLSWSVFLSYYVVMIQAISGQWMENDRIPFLIVAAPFSAFLASAFLRIRGGRKAARV